MKRPLHGFLLFLLAITVAAPAINFAADELDTTQQERYHAMIAELRCLVCQNQNIADSNAPLAQDLRKQVSEMILTGASDAEIKDYMVERYGDFVLYRPPIKPQTWLLWGGPFLLLLFGLFVALRLYRQGSHSSSETALDTDELERVLHEDNPEDPKP